MATIPSAWAVIITDSFGGGANAFAIDFTTVNNAGNGVDAGAGGGSYSSPYGGVAYSYRMAVTEVPQDWITKATGAGLTNVSSGPWAGSQPATYLTWYEAAAFVNWLNTSTGHQAAYDLTWAGSTWTMNVWSSTLAWDNDPSAGVSLNRYRHRDAYYFLPSEDEWYKSAFHKNDGATANYWDYATGSNMVPIPEPGGTAAGTAVYDNVTSSPVNVNSNGGSSAYGTIGQNGNVYEWTESAQDGVNSGASEIRAARGGHWLSPESDAVVRSR